MRAIHAPLPILLVFFVALGLRAADWPQFRGPTGDGHALAENLPLRWGGFLTPPAWQTPIPGSGWSSPLVVGDRIWLTAAEQTALTEPDREAKLTQEAFGDQQFQVHESVSLLAIELHVDDGRMLRRIELFTHDDPAPIHVLNSYASPTPVSDGRRLYCHFGSLGTVAVDMQSGEVLWKKRFAFDEITGPGNSPVLSDGLLILTCDGADEQYLVALHCESGEVAWRVNRPPIEAEDGKLRRAFSTPLVFEHAGRKQLVVPGAQWVVAYDPATGTELWRVNYGTGHAVIPRPVFRDGVVFICTGYVDHQLWAIRADGFGDVSDSHVLWRHTRQAPEIASPIIVGEEIYFASTLGIATCLDVRSGEMLWQQRLGGSYVASPLAADGKIYFTSNTGTTTVIRPGREYHELARNQLHGQTLASIAVAGRSLLIRTDAALYCIRADGNPGLTPDLLLPGR